MRLTDDLLSWLKERSEKTGVPMGCLIRDQLESARSGGGDTGFIVVFARRNDEHHDWAVNLGQGVTEPLLTCEAVLAEAAFRLESSAYVLRLINDGLLRLAFDCSKNLMELQDLARRYADRKRTWRVFASFE